MPSVKLFKNSNSPSFMAVDANGNSTGSVSTEFIMTGGNEDLNPDFLYSFGTGIGQTCVGYFFPYLTINDNGIPEIFHLPSYAATTYMQKFLGTYSGVYPWTIAAGINNGRIMGITKTEMDFTDDDLINLNQMGANQLISNLEMVT